MAKILGKLTGIVLTIIMLPIALILGVILGLSKSNKAKKNRVLFSGIEQNLIAKAQRAINANQNAIISFDEDILVIARCIEEARYEYQQLKTQERFDPTFSEFIKPRIKSCRVSDWDNVNHFYQFDKLEEIQIN